MNRRCLSTFAVAAGLLVFTMSSRPLMALGLKEYQASIDALVIEDPDFSQLTDGSYSGRFETKLVSAEVLVHLASGRITAIDLVEHKKGKGGPAEAITRQVIVQQSLAVDVVSGATASSKVILKSIEAAIKPEEER